MKERQIWQLIGRVTRLVSDVGEHRAGHYGDGDGSGEVVVTTIALVPQVKRLLVFTLFPRQRHLTHEGILQHVVVVDLRDAARKTIFTVNRMFPHVRYCLCPKKKHKPRCWLAGWLSSCRRAPWCWRRGCVCFRRPESEPSVLHIGLSRRGLKLDTNKSMTSCFNNPPATYNCV